MNNKKPLARDNQSVSTHSDDAHTCEADTLPKEGSSQPCILQREWGNLEGAFKARHCLTEVACILEAVRHGMTQKQQEEESLTSFPANSGLIRSLVSHRRASTAGSCVHCF